MLGCAVLQRPVDDARTMPHTFQCRWNVRGWSRVILVEKGVGYASQEEAYYKFNFRQRSPRRSEEESYSQKHNSYLPQQIFHRKTDSNCRLTLMRVAVSRMRSSSADSVIHHSIAPTTSELGACYRQVTHQRPAPDSCLSTEINCSTKVSCRKKVEESASESLKFSQTYFAAQNDSSTAGVVLPIPNDVGKGK